MKRKQSFGNLIIPYLFIAPTMIGLLIFAYIAMARGLFNSFTDTKWGFETNFVGFDNYIKAFQNKVFLTSFKNQILMAVVRVLCAITWPLLAAELMFFVRHKRLANLMKKMFVLPMLVPGIVTTLIWKYLYNDNYGINTILRNIGLESLAFDWINDSKTAMFAVLFAGFPFIAGLNFLIMHTGLNMVGDELYEAAVIDGATAWQVVRFVHIPNMMAHVKTVATLSLIGALGEYGSVAAMTSGGPGYATTIPALLMYRNAFQDGEFGYASALGIVIMIEVMILTFIMRKMIKTEEE